MTSVLIIMLILLVFVYSLLIKNYNYSKMLHIIIFSQSCKIIQWGKNSMNFSVADYKYKLLLNMNLWIKLTLIIQVWPSFHWTDIGISMLNISILNNIVRDDVQSWYLVWSSRSSPDSNIIVLKIFNYSRRSQVLILILSFI